MLHINTSIVARKSWNLSYSDSDSYQNTTFKYLSHVLLLCCRQRGSKHWLKLSLLLSFATAQQSTHLSFTTIKRLAWASAAIRVSRRCDLVLAHPYTLGCICNEWVVTKGNSSKLPVQDREGKRTPSKIVPIIFARHRWVSDLACDKL